MKHLKQLGLAALVAFVAAVMYLVYEQASDCTARGGQYARGVVGFVCIGEKR